MEAIREIFAPIRKTFQALGLTIESIDNQTVVVSKWKLLKLLCICLGYGLVLALYFRTENIYVPEASKMKIMDVVIICRVLSNVLKAAVLVLVGCKARNFVEHFRAIGELDRELAGAADIQDSNRRVKRQLLALVVFTQVGINVCGYLGVIGLQLLFSPAISPVRIVYSTVVFVYPRLIVSNMNIAIVGVLKLLRVRLDWINELIKSPASLAQCLAFHRSVVSLTRGVNSVNNLHILLWVLVNFGLIVSDVLIAIHLCLVTLVYTPFNLYVFVKNMANYTWDLFLLFKYLTELRRSANRTKRLIVGMNAKTEEEQNQVSDAILIISHNRLSFTAYGLFEIDNALLFSLCGAGFSYLFIMVQMDMVNSSYFVRGN